MFDGPLKLDRPLVIPAPGVAPREKAAPSFYVANPRSTGRCKVQMVSAPLGEPIADALGFSGLSRELLSRDLVDLGAPWEQPATKEIDGQHHGD
jgi:hypothetical protein